MLSDPDFSDYRKDYPSRQPDLSRQSDHTELIQLTSVDGLICFNDSKQVELVDHPPTGRDSEISMANKKYLWLIRLEDSKIILELDSRAVGKISRGRISHTNLSGGNEAYCGGELYFRSENEIFLNGGSSRYRAGSDQELKAVVRSLIQAGFKVSYAGWDEETATERRFWRGDPIFWTSISEVV